jgi:signal transduction histidine kinase/ActR/RegA family two-component response regulator
MNDPMDSRPGVPLTREGHASPWDLLDHLLEGFQIIDFDFRYVYVNEAVVAHGKSTREALLGRRMGEVYPGIEDTEMFDVLRECMQHREARSMDNRFRYPDGTSGWFELRFEPVPEGVAILSVNITERKRSDAALRHTLRALETLSRCNLILAHAEDEARFVRDICRLLVRAGDYAAAWVELQPADHGHGATSAEGQTIRVGRSPQPVAGERSVLALPIRSGTTRLGVLHVVEDSPDGFGEHEDDLLVEVARALAHGVDTLRARVAHARTRDQLAAAQRLEAVGRLAGGVAHDFNNLLSVILAYTGFVAEGMTDNPEQVEDLEQVQIAAERATELTRQLLAFSRRQVLEPRVLSLNQRVRSLEGMLRRLLGEDIGIEVHTADDLGNVVADPGQLEQVLMNLAVNARDAMEQGGRLTIETRNVELDPEFAGEGVAIEPGPYVQLSVSDTGVGMDEETRRHVFEPFFTTKEVGKGTGLGLAMVYGIIKQSDGYIWVYSEPGQGTTFKIYLPRVDTPLSDAPAPIEAPQPTGNETLLLVEDDMAVRQVAERALHNAGYQVLSAADGGEAAFLFQKVEGAVDLLVTDVVMPDVNGRELAETLRIEKPELKVLFTSGYADSEVIHQGVLDADTHFLSKPFTAASLAQKVRQVLDEEP